MYQAENWVSGFRGAGAGTRVVADVFGDMRGLGMGHMVGEPRQQLGFCMWGDGKPLEKFKWGWGVTSPAV